MSRERDVIKVQVWRLVLLWVVMLGLFGVMVSRLWSLQIAQTMEFQRRLSKQSLRSVRLPGIRGRIYDRTGAPLVENRPSYCLSLYLEELRRPGSVQRTVENIMDVLDRLAEVMDRPRQLQASDACSSESADPASAGGVAGSGRGGGGAVCRTVHGIPRR